MRSNITSVDLKKQPEYAEHYQATKTPKLVDVPSRPALMLDGDGGPLSPDFAEAISTLYPIAYGIRFAIKDRDQVAYTVLPLEGLWWAERMEDFVEANKENWLWSLLITQPPEVDEQLFRQIVDEVREKKKLPLIDRVRLDHYGSGPAAQVMHVGPYADEGPTIASLHQFIAEQGFELSGKHQEIYIGDPRRSAPEKLRTIVRQPYTAP